MPRYIALPPRAYVDAYGIHQPDRTIVVHESDRSQHPTGILGPDGNMLYRVEDRAPAGFPLRVPKRS